MKNLLWKPSMKNLIRYSATALSALVLASALPARAADAIDYSEFDGRYRADYLITASGASGFGKVKVNVNSLSQGKKLKIVISGSVAAGTIFPIFANLRFDQKKVSTNNFLIGLGGETVLTKPNRFSNRRKTFRFTLNTATGAVLAGNPISGSMRYTLRFGKRSLSLVGSGVADTGSTTSVFIRINGRKKG